MEKVNQETLDVGAVVVLIGHDHDVTVAEALGGLVRGAVAEAEDLLDVVNLGVVHDLIVLASRTLRSLPRSGKTPYRSRPTTERPDTASAFAESPSVRMRVQCSELRPPASLASSSLGMPVSLVAFLPSDFFISLLCLKDAQERICSTIPLLIICLMTLSLAWYLLPKLDARVLSVSLVCESNAGFSMRALTNTQRWFLT